MNYWLMKSEPDVFGIEHLRERPDQTEPWDGVRNYQARNMLRDQMQVGDLAFFYHSNCRPPGIVGIMEIVRAGYPDPTQFDPNSDYYDPKSDPDNPRWFLVDVKFKRQFKRMITLDELKAQPELAELAVVRKGNRLSICPVGKSEWDFIVGME